MPLLSLTPNVNDLVNGTINLNDVSIMQPAFEINLSQQHPPDSNIEKKLPLVNIHSINIQQPVLFFKQPGKNGATTIEWNGQAANNFLQIDDISINQKIAPSILISKLNISLDHFLFGGAKGNTFDPGKGKISSQVKSISLSQTGNKQWGWNAVVTSLEGKNFQLDSMGKKAGRLVINNGELKEFAINSTNIKNIQQLIATNSSFLLSRFNGSYSDINNNMQWYNAGFDRSNKTFTVDSFAFHPTPDRETFEVKQLYQNDYIKIKTGAIRVGPFDLDTYIKDSTMNIGTLLLDNVFMTDYRDNHSLPFRAGRTKLLPSTLIQTRIPFRLSIDTVRLNNANIEYTEVGAKTKEAGTLSVTKMTIKIFPVRNYNLTNADSLRIQMNGYLMDTAWLRLRVRESYADSLGGFFMSLRLKPTDPMILNPVLIPLSSAKLQSGYLDTVSLRVIGKDYLAFGEMKMHYHDLKIKFLKNGSETKKSFLTGLITFVANSFVIRNKNRSRTGTVFFIRDRDRSAINYFIKIALSGVASSVGAKSNRKLLHKYKKELRQRNLAPLDYD